MLRASFFAGMTTLIDSLGSSPGTGSPSEASAATVGVVDAKAKVVGSTNVLPEGGTVVPHACCCPRDGESGRCQLAPMDRSPLVDWPPSSASALAESLSTPTSRGALPLVLEREPNTV